MIRRVLKVLPRFQSIFHTKKLPILLLINMIYDLQGPEGAALLPTYTVQGVCAPNQWWSVPYRQITVRHVYVCVCICMYICMYVCILSCTYTPILYLYVCTRAYIYMYIYMYIIVYLYSYSMRICLHVCLCIDVYVLV
jgi:hypothetical protein